MSLSLLRSGLQPIWCAALLAAASPALAEPPAPAITVEGEASADVAPDVALLAIGVQVERPTATAATAELARGSQAVLAAAKDLGIDTKDIGTTALTVFPVYPDSRPAASAPSPRAFRASTTVQVTIRQADRAGDVASRLVAVGANTIEGIDYAVSDEAKRLDGLRTDATRDARHKAEIYAEALGLHLGQVLEVLPAGGDRPHPPVMRAAMAKSAVATAPGTLTLQTAVTIRWALQP